MDLSIRLGRLALKNPILVASGTFGYAQEFENLIDLSRLGGIIPKTVTREPRPGNPPPRTVETASGLLNSIGLDNDGIDYFIRHHLPRLRGISTAIIVNVAGRTYDEFVELADLVGKQAGVAALELNISCPNVSGGVDFGTNPETTARVVRGVRSVCPIPVLAKLTPNVTDVVAVAQAAADGGADALSLVNTFLGLAVNWRARRPILGGVTGGLSGPAIKPLALRVVWQVAKSVSIPIIGIGGISTIDDVMDYIVCGASAVQVGTANFFDPTVAARLIDELPIALGAVGAASAAGLVGGIFRESSPKHG
jgi:dihydroorotate dehydrogenase (NAD+) catalytic subunit